MRIWLLLAPIFLAASCAREQPARDIPPPADCPGAYVILPANFIIDLAANAEVWLDPGVQEFALFCSPQEAGKILEEHRESNTLPKGSDWKIYRLDGGFHSLAGKCRNGGYCLGQRAAVEDWVSPDAPR